MMLLDATNSGVSFHNFNAASFHQKNLKSKTKKVLKFSKLQELNILSSCQIHCNFIIFPKKLEATLSSHPVKHQHSNKTERPSLNVKHLIHLNVKHLIHYSAQILAIKK